MMGNRIRINRQLAHSSRKPSWASLIHPLTPLTHLESQSAILEASTGLQHSQPCICMQCCKSSLALDRSVPYQLWRLRCISSDVFNALDVVIRVSICAPFERRINVTPLVSLRHHRITDELFRWCGVQLKSWIWWYTKVEIDLSSNPFLTYLPCLSTWLLLVFHLWSFMLR